MIVEGNYISDNISYSQLKIFDEEGAKGLLKPKNLDGKGIRFGSLLDDYLFLSKEDFTNKYEVVNTPLLAGDEYKLAVILKNQYSSFNELIKVHTNEKYKDSVIEIIKANKLFGRVSVRSTFLSKFDNKEFYDFVKKLYEDKILIHISDLVFAKNCKGELLSNKKTKHYFINEHENIYQANIQFEYRKQNVKCLLDMLIINHKDKIITPIDLKTGSPGIEDFKQNFFNYKYYLQGAIYNKAAEEYNKKHFNGKYKIEEFKFLYLCRYDISNPLIYRMSSKWNKAGLEGFKTLGGWKYRGINQLMDELLWHKENKKFNHSREIYENSEVYLDDSYIIVD